MKSRYWPRGQQIQPLWLCNQLQLMIKLNSTESQFFSLEISHNHIHGCQFPDVCPPSPRRRPPLSALNSKILNYNGQWEVRTLYAMVFSFPLSMVKFIMCCRIGGNLGNIWSNPDSGVAVAQSFFCFGLPSLAPLPLDYQWIYASSKLMNQVICNWEERINLEGHLLGVVPTCIQFIKSWWNYLALSKVQHIDFI
jgi:hypothetical protein